MSALPKHEFSPFDIVRNTHAESAHDVVSENADPNWPVAQRWAALPDINIARAVAANSRLVAHDSGKRAIPFDALRAKLCAQAAANGLRKIAITSATPRVGKSTLIANLALAFARAADKRVLICELNQRNPALASLFAMNPRRDISDVLFDALEFGEQGVRLQTSVAIAFSQNRQRGILETHRPHDIHRAIDQLADAYQPDLILYDLPNIYEDDATFSFLSGMDCALAVARQDLCRMSALDDCERQIAAQTQFLGFVITKATDIG